METYDTKKKLIYLVNLHRNL